MEPFNSPTFRRLSRFVIFASWLSILVGVAGIAGWVFHVRLLKTILPGLVTIKANTAICFVLLGISLWLQRKEPARARDTTQWAARALALIIAVVGALSLTEAAFGWDLGIDQLLFKEPLEEAFGSLRPGLMSQVTAANFLLLGSALLFLEWRTRRRIWPAQFLCWSAGILSSFTLLDFILKPRAFHTHIALQTVLTFCVVFFAPIAARAERVLATAGSQKNGILARLLLAGDGDEHWMRQWPVRYAMTVMLVVVAALLRHMPSRFVPEHLTYATFYPAVMISAMVGGFWPGLLATLASAACVDYYFLEPFGEFGIRSPSEVTGMFLFLVVGIGMSVLAGMVESTRHRAAEAVRRSEGRLQLQIERMPLACIVWDRNFRVESWNPAAEKIFGFSAQEVLGRLPYESIVPGYLEADIRKVFANLLQGDTAAHSTNDNLTKDGRSILCHWTNTPLKDPDGNVTGVLSMVEDITERVQAEEALRTSEERYRNLTEALPQMIFLKDQNSSYLSCNQNFADLLGMNPEEFPGKTDYDFFPAELAEKYRADDRRVIESGSTEEITESYIRNEQKMYVQTIKKPFRDAEGHTIGILGMFWDITARKQADEKLRQQAALLDLAHDAILVRDLDYRIVFWSRGAKDTYGFSLHEAVGQVAHALLHTEFPLPLATIESLIGEKREWEGELRHTCRDGKQIVVASRWSLLRDEDGKRTAILEINRDITERKRAEEALQMERQRFSDVLDRLPAYVVLIAPDYHVPFANKFFRERFGDSNGRRCYEYLFERQEPCEICETYKTLKTGLPQRWKWTGPDAHNYDVYDFPFTDTDGSALILEMGIDITERERAEAEVRKASLYTRSLIEASLDPLVTISREGKITDVNEASERVTGVSRAQLIGSDFCDYFTQPEQARKGYQEVFSAGFVHDYALAIRHVSGTITDVLYNATVFKNEKGEVEGVFAAARDISRIKQAELEIHLLNAELEQRVIKRTAELEAANKELEAFTYSVSHDLRAPLRHISGFSKILTEEFGSSLPPEAHRHLQRIQEGTGRMGALVDDLLNLARVGRQELRQQVTGLNSLVDEVIAGLKPEYEGRQVEWKISSLPFVECDPGLMRQVLQNLASNAVKFTRPRARAVIEIGQSEQQGAPVIFVRDNGVGFNMKYADKLFGVFQRLHRVEDFEGTGVGLATVYRILHKHGGTIWAEAEIDKGATFYFTLAGTRKEDIEAKAASVGGNS